MDRDEAIKLLRGGKDRIAEWNRRYGGRWKTPDLSSANLSGANLSAANLSNAKLGNANLRDPKLGNANLCNANLRDAVLYGANLHDANLASAIVAHTVFGDIDLSACKSLNVVHRGPSTLGTNTLMKSKGSIPSEFLRGCGVSPWEVEMARLYDPGLSASQVSELISVDIFSTRTVGPLYLGGVFISYSHTEKRVADKIYKKLHDAGASVWLDRHDAIAGDLNKQIQREIRLSDVVLLILSGTSVESDWVEHELKSARTKEKEEERDVLCPIAVDDSWKPMMGNPNWGHLSDKLILDFSKWETDAFDKQFDKLLKGMKIHYEVRK